MREIGISYSQQMMVPLLDGRKTQTRRPMKPQPVQWFDDDGGEAGFTWKPKYGNGITWTREKFVKRAPYQPGDRFYPKEIFKVEPLDMMGRDHQVTYKVDGSSKILRGGSFTGDDFHVVEYHKFCEYDILASHPRTARRQERRRMMQKTITVCDGCGKELKTPNLYVISTETFTDAAGSSDHNELSIDLCNVCLRDIKTTLEKIWAALQKQQAAGE